jgi:enterochelin esterase-like enzyme
MFSGGLWGPAEEVDQLIIEQADTLAAVTQPELIWIACGTRDFAMDSTHNLRRVLDGLAISYLYHEDDSDHNWAAWRDFLPRFLEAANPVIQAKINGAHQERRPVAE